MALFRVAKVQVQHEKIAMVKCGANRTKCRAFSAKRLGRLCIIFGMDFSFAPPAAPTPLEYFQTLVQDEDSLSLLEAASSIAQDVYPDLDLHLVLDEVDLLAAKLQRRIPADSPDLQKLLALNHFFYRELNFAGNINDYYDPQNSYIHAVLRTRRGIPISLALLWLELAERIGLAAAGVGFPGHFMIKVSLDAGQVILDPMTGQSLTREDLLDRLGGAHMQLLGAEEEVPMGLFLQPASAHEMLERMLRNLREIYAGRSLHERELAVINRLLVLLPESWSDYRERAQVLVQLGHIDAALGDLQTYLRAAQDASDAEAVRQQVAKLQAKS